MHHEDMIVGSTLFPCHAVVTEVHDGDTFKASIDMGVYTGLKDRDLGFHFYVENHRVVMHADVRLLGCNATELAAPGGVEARDHLLQMMPVGTKVTLLSAGADKYGGRCDCGVTLPDGSDLVMQLIRDNWAAPWNGVGPKPTPPWPRPTA